MYKKLIETPAMQEAQSNEQNTPKIFEHVEVEHRDCRRPQLNDQAARNGDSIDSEVSFGGHQPIDESSPHEAIDPSLLFSPHEQETERDTEERQTASAEPRKRLTARPVDSDIELVLDAIKPGRKKVWLGGGSSGSVYGVGKYVYKVCRIKTELQEITAFRELRALFPSERHPNLLQGQLAFFVNFIENDGQIKKFLVLKTKRYCQSLAELLSSPVLLTMEAMKSLVLQLVDGLHSAHFRQKSAHLDLKPGNIFVDVVLENGKIVAVSVVIGDFGSTTSCVDPEVGKIGLTACFAPLEDFPLDEGACPEPRCMDVGRPCSTQPPCRATRFMKYDVYSLGLIIALLILKVRGVEIPSCPDQGPDEGSQNYRQRIGDFHDDIRNSIVKNDCEAEDLQAACDLAQWMMSPEIEQRPTMDEVNFVNQNLGVHKQQGQIPESPVLQGQDTKLPLFVDSPVVLACMSWLYPPSIPPF